MGNCDSCIGGRERPNSFDKSVKHTSLSNQRVERNEIQYASGGDQVHHRIVPFDRRPSIKIPEPEKPRKPYGI